MIFELTNLYITAIEGGTFRHSRSEVGHAPSAPAVLNHALKGVACD